mmetsp:Transcript_10192/g.32271  ORF Transcript_10192/g.32271 Transcript_10192/m.32271 type:complete len:429 (+) Transcript_10192:97-1383(+)
MVPPCSAGAAAPRHVLAYTVHAHAHAHLTSALRLRLCSVRSDAGGARVGGREPLPLDEDDHVLVGRHQLRARPHGPGGSQRGRAGGRGEDGVVVQAAARLLEGADGVAVEQLEGTSLPTKVAHDKRREGLWAEQRHGVRDDALVLDEEGRVGGQAAQVLWPGLVLLQVEVGRARDDRVGQRLEAKPVQLLGHERGDLLAVAHDPDWRVAEVPLPLRHLLPVRLHLPRGDVDADVLHAFCRRDEAAHDPAREGVDHNHGAVPHLARARHPPGDDVLHEDGVEDRGAVELGGGGEQVPQPRAEQVLVAAEARVEQVVPLLLAALPHALLRVEHAERIRTEALAELRRSRGPGWHRRARGAAVRRRGLRLPPRLWLRRLWGGGGSGRRGRSGEQSLHQVALLDAAGQVDGTARALVLELAHAQRLEPGSLC